MSSAGGAHPSFQSSLDEEYSGISRLSPVGDFLFGQDVTPVSTNELITTLETPITPVHQVSPYPLEIETPGSFCFPLEPMSRSPPHAPQIGGTSSTFFFGVRTSPNGQHADILSPNSGKRERLTLSGKKQATPRRIGSVWDDIDHIIFDLKNKSYSNKEIAEEIKQLGVHYDPKTIGTRYLRLKARTSNLEKEGKETIQHREWSTEEDAALLAAYEKALDSQSDRIARIKAKFWSDCVENISKLLEDTDGLTKEVCEYRWITLTNNNTNHSMNREGTTLLEIPTDSNSTAAYDNLDESFFEHNERGQNFVNGNENYIQQLDIASNDAVEDNEKHQHLENLRRLYGFDSSVPSTPITRTQSARGHGNDNASPTPRYRGGARLINAADPRSVMLSTELDIELKNRGLSRTGTKAALLKRLNEDDARHTIKELQIRLSKRSLPTDGTKAELIQRIRDHDVANCEWGKRKTNAALEEAARGRFAKRQRNVIEEALPSKRARGLQSNEILS